MLFAQQEEFKLTFNHQALPVKKLQETGDLYSYFRIRGNGSYCQSSQSKKMDT